MKLLLIISFSCFLSCNSNNEKERIPEEQERYNKIYDSIGTEIDKKVTEALTDTNGIHEAPLQVIKAKFVKKEYSSYRDVQLTYKNVSNKTIVAERFAWYAENAFGEPANAGGLFNKGTGGGFAEDKIRPGKTVTGTWSILSRDGKKIIKAWASEVVFEDGTKWKFETIK